MKTDSYTLTVLKFAARIADRTGLFALVLTALALVGAYLMLV